MSAMVAITVETMKSVAIVAAAALLLLAIITAKVMATVTKKIVSAVVFVALAALVWNQRASLSECATDLTDRAEQAASTRDVPDAATCTFIGYDVTVDLPGS